MRWGHIITEVLFFWLECGCLCRTYTYTKECATREPSSPEKVSAKKRLIFCAKCAGIIGLIALLVSVNYHNDIDYNRGAIVFIALLVPALVGAAEGFNAEPKPKPRPPPSDSDW